MPMNSADEGYDDIFGDGAKIANPETNLIEQSEEQVGRTSRKERSVFKTLGWSGLATCKMCTTKASSIVDDPHGHTSQETGCTRPVTRSVSTYEAGSRK